MKTRLALLGWVLLTVPALAQNSAKVPTKAPVSATSQLVTDLVGVWTFVGEPGQAASAEKKIKVVLDKRYMFSQYDPTSNVTLFNHGGNYLLDGTSYVETLEYGSQSMGGLIGQTFRYTLKIEGDTMTLTGVGNPWNEVWKRVR